MHHDATRPLHPAESAFIEDVFCRLREHFHQWKGYHAEGMEHELIEFALYEGCGGSECCGEIIAEASPFALGSHLAHHEGFQWCMIENASGPEYAVTHEALDEPIALMTLDSGTWCDHEYDDDDPPAAGVVTIDSLECIIARTKTAIRKLRQLKRSKTAE